MTKEPKLTERQRLLAGEIGHHDYYLSIARELGLTIPENMMAKVRRCKERSVFGGCHLTLNEVPSSKWYGLAGGLGGNTPRRSEVFRSRGDQWSLAGMVCALKAAAQAQLEAKGGDVAEDPRA